MFKCSNGKRKKIKVTKFSISTFDCEVYLVLKYSKFLIT